MQRNYTVSSGNEHESVIIIKNVDSIQPWKGQRPLDDSKVEEIVYYKTHNLLGNTISDFGEIHLCEFRNGSDKKLYLIDGQHRFAAYKRLLNTPNYAGVLPKLRALLHFVSTDSQIRDIFNVINRCTPVPEIYLGTSNDIKKQLKSYLEEYCQQHRLKIGSGGCKRPAMDLDKYTEQLYDEQYLDNLDNNHKLTKLLNGLCVYIHKNLVRILKEYKIRLNISESMEENLKNYSEDSKMYLGYFYSTNKRGFDVLKHLVIEYLASI